MVDNQIIEIWKDIPSYEGLYQVSSLGNVKSLYREYYCGNYPTKRIKLESILKSAIRKDGYINVVLTKDGKSKSFFTHRLVAIAFLCNDNGSKEVNHKDFDKSNNNLSNLEWCSRKYNINHAAKADKMGRKLGKHGMANIVLDTNTGIFYMCAKEAAKAICINYSTLINKLSNQRNHINNTSLMYV